MNAEIISIGDEITSGQLLDTNTQWISRRLEEMGVRVLFHTTVGDELQPNIDVFRHAIDRADLIVATGGLGPTADDLTREALARATGRELELDPDALQYIRDMFARRRRPMPPQNELQAMFPAGSQVVRNPHGTAPGIDLEVPREARSPCRVICLPGVPAEVFEMWDDSVAPTIDRLLGANRRLIRRHRIHCFGAGESQIESMLPDMIRRGRRPTVGITASKATITLRIAADGQTEQECFEAMKSTIATIRECLGSLIFGEGDDQLQDAVLRRLAQRHQTLATAECCTAGLLARWLASVDSAGQTVPATESLADTYRGGLVFAQTAESAEALAVRCREQFNADYGLAVVHPATFEKGDDSEGGEPETAVIALASSAGVQQKRIPPGMHPALTRIYVAKQALNLMRLMLLDA